MLIKTTNYASREQRGYLAPQGGLVGWAGARARCAPPFPEHHLGKRPCSGTHLNQCTLLCRSRQLCLFVFRSNACWFSAMRARGAAIGGTFWPAWPTHCTLHQWAGSAAHRLPSVAVVPIFAYSTDWGPCGSNSIWLFWTVEIIALGK